MLVGNTDVWWLVTVDVFWEYWFLPRRLGVRHSMLLAEALKVSLGD